MEVHYVSSIWGTCQQLLNHQEEIPGVLRGKVVFVFPDWRNPGFPEDVACVDWYGYNWARRWSLRGDDFDGLYRVLRRKSARTTEVVQSGG